MMKVGKPEFFEESFLIANINIKIAVEIVFLTLSNVMINILE